MAGYTENEVRAHLEADGSGLVTLGDGKYHVINPDSTPARWSVCA